MNTTRILAVSLLLTVGASAVAGGGAMVLDPSGKSLGLSVSLLANTPFADYFIPGLLLFLCIGIFGIATGILTLRKHSFASRLTILHGAILAGWIAIQAFLLQTIDPIQVVVGGIGFTLFCLGLFEADEEPVLDEDDPI